MFKNIFSLFCLTATVLSLDIESVKETKWLRTSPKVDGNLDKKWLKSVGHWYYGAGSKLDYFRSVGELLEAPPSEITDSEFYYDSCPTWDWTNFEKLVLTGFNDKSFTYIVKQREDGGVDIIPEPKGRKLGGKGYFTKSDNKNYVFWDIAWEDGEASWGVLTTKKVLEETVLNEIYEHAKSLGFDKKYFTQMRYESCKNLPHKLH